MTTAASPSPEQVFSELERMLASKVFARSARLCRFLRFSVESALSGTADQIKEQLIGVEVFDRKTDYDPRIDPIVRVEARRLRAKLKAYYASAGRGDDVVISFPKGSYVPVIKTRATVLRTAALRSSSPAVIPLSDYRNSIAALPFANLTPDEIYFSDGLTEEIIHRLTRIPELRVVAWNSTSKVRDAGHDVAAIRRLLNVKTVLCGTVRRAADRIRVTAQLIDCESGAYLWSDRYDRKAENVFAIQDEIARAIVLALELKLTPFKQKDSSTNPPSLAYYSLCLQGRFLVNKRTKEHLQKGLARFEEAIQADNAQPQGYAGLADAYSLLADYGFLRPDEAMPRAKAAAERALQLDPQSVEANVSLAYVRSIHEWKWSEAETLYRTALALNPGSSHAHHWYGVDYLALQGRFDEAKVEVRRALHLDPLSSIIHEGVGYVDTISGDFETGLATYRTLNELDPGFYKVHSAIGRVLFLLGRYEEAVAAFEYARSLAGPVPSLLAALGQSLAMTGKLDAARLQLQELETLSRTSWVPACSFAVLHLGLRDHTAALKYLEIAADRREIPICALKVHPLYDPLRSEPAFERLLERIGFSR